MTRNPVASLNIASSTQATENKVELPVLSGTLGFDVIDVRQLGKEGVFSFDPGFLATASCASQITYIDGNQGILLHRGYPIEQLAEKANFIEVAHLLYYGELPGKAQYQHFSKGVRQHASVVQPLQSLLAGFPSKAHPMAILSGVIGALPAFYQENIDINDEQQRELAALHLIGKIPTIAAMIHRHALHEAFVEPRDDLDYADNFLYMMFGQANQSWTPNPVLSRAMDRVFILHADHEQNASTSTVRMAGSTGTHPFSSILAGIAALWGPAHGGANEACLRMLSEIGDVKHIDHFIKRAKDKSDPFRLMGFGHRVYKNHDPRAQLMRESCHQVLNELNKHDDPLLKIALKLEKIALEDDYFVSKKLYPNVDFYSGIMLKALGIPTTLFTVMFALARTTGWISQWNEMMSDPDNKINRPRQLYKGHGRRDVA